MFKKLGAFLKKDVVLTTAMVLAMLSCFIVIPNGEYLGYIDFNTLILLFCLMVIIEGLKDLSFFEYIGSLILSKVTTKKTLILTLVLLCFFSSMLITNDVALITFVPFAIMILEMANQTSKLCYTITLMTIAANLGSMFTPIGNPQNLYLFSLSQMDILAFLRLMLPFTLAALIMLVIAVLFGYPQSSLKVIMKDELKLNKGNIAYYLCLFVLCLLCVAKLLPHLYLFIIVLVMIIIKKRSLLSKVDYSLLLTFIFFFIFVGNIKHLPAIDNMIKTILSGNEKMISILLSQVISNVPCAMLLANYTTNLKDLIIGTNLGGLGTLIASMASLISYKQIANKYPQLKNKYLLIFTAANILFLIILYLI